jgi:hypothetical protein
MCVPYMEAVYYVLMYWFTVDELIWGCHIVELLWLCCVTEIEPGFGTCSGHNLWLPGRSGRWRKSTCGCVRWCNPLDLVWGSPPQTVRAQPENFRVKTVLRWYPNEKSDGKKRYGKVFPLSRLNARYDAPYLSVILRSPSTTHGNIQSQYQSGQWPVLPFPPEQAPLPLQRALPNG